MEKTGHGWGLAAWRRLTAKARRARNNAARRPTVFVLAALLLAAGYLDAVSTDAALAAGHLEANPVVGMLLSIFGPLWVAPKILLHLGAACLLLWLPTRRMVNLARIVSIGYFFILLNNLSFLFSHG